MLPAAFEKDPKSRVSTTALAIFAVAILAVGFVTSGLLTFTVRDPAFQASNVFSPALRSCVVGLLTVPYCFIVSARYTWNTPALLSVIAATLSTVVYTILLIWTYRRSRTPEKRPSIQSSMPLQQNAASPGESAPWQEPAYYKNYIQNMFPASANQPPPSSQQLRYDPGLITEEDMQRQQMLMLLQNSHSPASTPAPNTFKIDWQSGEPDEEQQNDSLYTSTSASSSSNPVRRIARQLTNQEQMQPWDGVWRDPTPVVVQRARASSRDSREQRRREIESGR